MLRVRELAFVTVAGMAAMTAASFWPAIKAQAPTAAAATVAPKKAEWVKVQVRIPLTLKTLEGVTPTPVAAKPNPKAPDLKADEDDKQSAPVEPPIATEAELDAQADQVGERLRARVPPAALRYFDVLLYVSKAGNGPWAQHMFIFHRGDDGSLVYEKNIPVSTGRERHEKYFTSTPAGIFELDPARFEPMHYSHTWHNAPMAWAMFLNYTLHNRQVGIALHSAGPHVADLGHRASGGCVRLPPDKASELYHRFQAEERGMVPVWAFDSAAGTTSTMAEMVRGPSGQPLMTEGYKVLLVIEDYPGGPALVAVLS
jgi:lipoprotein-anchoring transpeptidase ErfK/SrfK